MGVKEQNMTKCPVSHLMDLGRFHIGSTLRFTARGSSQRARELIDGISDPLRCEFVAEVASALPLRVICDILGVPEAERQTVRHQRHRVLAILNFNSRRLWAL